MKSGVPKMGIGLVDVRDVANAHVKAGYTPSANGRYITSAYNTNIFEMALALQQKFGDKFPIPKKALPKWLLMIVGPMANKLFTRKFIRNNVDIEWKADNSKIKKALHMKFLPLKQTMEEGFQVLVDEKIILPKK
jgi:nucleoside-diphosphate-sugar epimerase